MSNTKSPVIEGLCEAMSQAAFGRSRNEPVCVTCGNTKVSPSDFRDDVSRKEFGLSRMCQNCQDDFFGA